MAKRRLTDTTVPPIAGGFEDAVRALLNTPAPPKNLGRPKAKKRKAAKKRGPKEERLVVREDPADALARLLKPNIPPKRGK